MQATHNLRGASPGDAPGRRAPSPAWLWCLLAVAAVLRLWYLLDLRRTPFYDSLLLDLASYDAWARRIAAGDWLGSRVFYQDPLYPYFLATLYTIFGRQLLVVYLVQIAIAVFTCFVVYDLTRRLFGVRAGLVACGLAAVYRPFIFHDVQVEKSLFAVLLVAASAWRLEVARREGAARQWIFAGLVLGLAILIRGNYLVLLPLVLGGIALGSPKGNRLRPVLMYLAGASLVIGATTARNFVVGRDFVLTTSQAGQNLYIGNNPANATGMYRAPGFVRADPRYEETDFSREAEKRAGRPLKPSEVSAYWNGEAVRFIVGQPAEFVAVLGRKIALFWNAHEIPDNLDQYFMQRYSVVLRLWLPTFGVVAPLGIAGMAFAAGRWRETWSLYAFVIVYFASVVVFYVFARYRLPVVPFLMAFAGYAVDRALSECRGGIRRLLPGMAAFTVSIPLVNLQLVDTYNPSALTNLGAVTLGSGNTAEAEEILRGVVARRPEYADARNNLGIALLRRGDLPGAVEQFGQAVRLSPGKPGAWVNLAEAQSRLGNRDGARRAAERALELDPRSGDAWAALGGIRREGGDLAGSVEAFRKAVEFDPLSASHANNLGVTLVRSDAANQALAHLKRAIELRPEFGEAHFNLGVCYERLLRPAEAAESYRRAAGTPGGDGRAWANLASVLADSGDRAGAVEAYRRFLEVWRGDPAARTQVEREIDRLR